jgi:heme-degrading monooxygenase HmoA
VRHRLKLIVERAPGRRGGPTFALWTPGAGGAGGPVLVSVTDFAMGRGEDVIRVYFEGLRLRRVWPSMRGAVGMWLWTKPLGRRAGSVSIWRSEEDLRRFVRWPVHVGVMRRYRHVGVLRSTSWSEPSCDRSRIWASAVARLAADDRAPARDQART